MIRRIYIMTGKRNIYYLLIRPALIVLLVFVPEFLFAQEDGIRTVKDSTRIQLSGEQLYSPSASLYIETLPTALTLHPLIKPQLPSLGSISDFSLKETFHLPYQLNPSLLFRGDYNTNGVLHQFSNGVLFGHGGQTSVPGIGRFNDASLGYQHAFGDRLTFQASVNSMKVNMSHITGQTFSTSGSFMYRASDRLAFKVFGSYNIGNSYGMSTNSYGATMVLDMSDRFGVEVGAQRYYNTMSSRWETVPIVIPYYNFDKFKLGLDVGGILYEILRGAMFGKEDWSGGPTIAPPRFSPSIRGR